MIICIVFLLIISLSSCQQHHVATQKDEKNIVVCFDHYHPKPYKTPGGIKHTLMPKALYTDNTEILKEYMPEADFDTITLQSSEDFKELALNYRDFEFIYYPLIQGDTVTVSMDSLDYPILSSKHHLERNRIYNMNYELRKGRTHSGLEAKTCLGSDWVRIAQSIDVIRANNWTSLIMDYCPLDSLHSMFNSYKAAYTDTINLFKKQQIISDKAYNHYQQLLELKDYESQRMLNEDTTFYRQMEAGISDEYASYPSYHEYLDYYLWFTNQHIPTIRKTQIRTGDKPSRNYLPNRSNPNQCKSCLNVASRKSARIFPHKTSITISTNISISPKIQRYTTISKSNTTSLPMPTNYCWRTFKARLPT